MAYISDGDWNRYNDIINNFINEDAGKQLITWRRYAGNLASFGEDAGLSYVEDTLEVLAGYNNFRTWPILKEGIPGADDPQNIIIWVSKKYLEDRGLLNSDGYFNYDAGYDRFVINGITYKSGGDTQVSQNKTYPLLFMIILKRDIEK